MKLLRDKLIRLLSDAAPIGDNLTRAIDLAEKWYRHDKSPAPTAAWSIFNDLFGRGWEDQQGVPTAHYEAFKTHVQPHLVRILEDLEGMEDALRGMAMVP